MKAQNLEMRTDVAQETYTNKGRNLHKGASLAELTSPCSSGDAAPKGYVACLDWPSTSGDMEDGRCHMMGMASLVCCCEFLLIFINPAYRAGHTVARVLIYYGLITQIHCLPCADAQD